VPVAPAFADPAVGLWDGSDPRLIRRPNRETLQRMPGFASPYDVCGKNRFASRQTCLEAKRCDPMG